MIQSKPFTSNFNIGSPPSSASMSSMPLLSSLSIGGPKPSQDQQQQTQPQPHQTQPHLSQQQQFGVNPYPINEEGLIQQTFNQHTQPQQHSEELDGQTLPGSTFFPTNTFRFSSQGSINSISQSLASTSINQSIASNSFLKSSSIAGINKKLPGAITQPAISNFFPNSPQTAEDLSNCIPLRVINLPRDIKEHEFNVLFTFAPEFVFSEVQKGPTAEDGLPSTVTGIGYFKSMNAANNALSVLTSNPHLFIPRESAQTSPQNAIKCEILYNRFQEPQPLHVPTYSQPYPQQSGYKSRFVFSSGVGNPNPLSKVEMPQHSGTYSELYSTSDVNGRVFSPTSPRNLFPGSNEKDFVTGEAGKSLLLESQSKEDEEYSDLVKDPIGWFSKTEPEYFSQRANSSAPSSSGFQSAPQQPSHSSAPGSQDQGSGSSSGITSPAKPQQHSQSNSRAQSPPVSTNNTSANKGARSNSTVQPPSSNTNSNAWTDKRRGSTARGFQNLSINSSTGVDNSKVVVPYSPTSNSSAIQILQSGGRVMPPANPADQNPPCNTLYVGNLPPDTNEDELKEIFSARPGYKRLSFRTKANGPMCFVEFEDVSYATLALKELYGIGLSNSVKGGIRLSYSKNPLGVRSQPNNNNNGNNNNNNNNGNNNGNSNGNLSHHSRIGSQHVGYNSRANGNNNNNGNNYSVNDRQHHN